MLDEMKKLPKDVYKKLTDELYDGVYFVNKSRRIIFWNKQAEKISGYRKGEVLAQQLAERHPGEIYILQEPDSPTLNRKLFRVPRARRYRPQSGAATWWILVLILGQLLLLGVAHEVGWSHGWNAKPTMIHDTLWIAPPDCVVTHTMNLPGRKKTQVVQLCPRGKWGWMEVES